jgi:hypothetical protein
MKTNKILSVIFGSAALSLLVSCTNTNTPELDASFYSTVATEALSTTVSESAIYESDVTLKSAIAKANLQSIGAQKVVGFGFENEDSKDLDDSDKNTYPNVFLVSKINEYPKEYVIDYGKGYVNKNKVSFTGKIFYTVSDKSSIKTEYKFSDFYINEQRVEGRRTVEVIEQGHVLFIVSEEKTQLANGKTTYRYSERTRTKVEDIDNKEYGENNEINDNKEIGDNDKNNVKALRNNYLFVISTKGINAKGVEYSVETKEPVLSVYNKKGFVKGVIVITTGQGSKDIDYSKEKHND